LNLYDYFLSLLRSILQRRLWASTQPSNMPLPHESSPEPNGTGVEETTIDPWYLLGGKHTNTGIVFISPRLVESSHDLLEFR